MKAQAKILAKADSDAAASADAAALEFTQAEVAAAVRRSGAATRATTPFPEATWRLR
jgi:hypothetical protein